MPDTWASLPLCTVDDVVREIGDLKIARQGNDAVIRRANVKKKISLAKEQLFEILESRVRDIYADENGAYWYGSTMFGSYGAWLTARGYTHDDLDGWEDRITNPTVLTFAAVAFTIRNVLLDSIMRFGADWEKNSELLESRLGYYEHQCKERLERAIRLLKIDLDESGTIDDHERVRTQMGTSWRL